MNQFKPKVSWLLLALFSFSTITVAQDFGFSNLPKPMDVQDSVLDVSGISIPHKPEISSTTHFENISRIINDLDSEVVPCVVAVVSVDVARKRLLFECLFVLFVNV